MPGPRKDSQFRPIWDAIRFGWAWGNPEHASKYEVRLRIHHAYAAAWNARSSNDPTSDEPFLAELFDREVPGSESDPAADPVLAPYIACWRAGKDPRTMKADLGL